MSHAIQCDNCFEWVLEDEAVCDATNHNMFCSRRCLMYYWDAINAEFDERDND